MSLKKKDIANAEQSIKFLEEQMLKTNLSEVRIALSSLVQEQVKKVMVAKSSKDYLLVFFLFPMRQKKKIHRKVRYRFFCYLIFFFSKLFIFRLIFYKKK